LDTLSLLNLPGCGRVGEEFINGDGSGDDRRSIITEEEGEARAH